MPADFSSSPAPKTRSELEALQAERLASLVGEIIPRNRFWAAKFSAAKLTPRDIRQPGDLRKLPFTTKAEILADQQANPPYGTNLTYELSAYSRLNQTSGTTGTPMRWLDTPQSWEAMLRSWGQLYLSMGLRPEDRLFFPFSFGPFLGFWAAFEGANRLGNLCIPSGGLTSLARLRLMLENDATFVCCTPTYALRLAEVAAENKLDLAGSAVRAILVAGEPGGNIPAIRQRIETTWGARVFDHWGMTELGPLATEAVNDPGNQFLLETDCIAEVIDPATGDAVAPGVEGELVVTNFSRPGRPLLRYRTGDRVLCAPTTSEQFATDPFLRLTGGVLGRVDDMLTIRGNNLYPSALEDVIRQFDEVAEYRIEVRTIKAMQHVRIEIEPRPQAVAAGPKLADQIARLIKDRWYFHAEVVPVAPQALPRFEAKGRRFFKLD